MKSIYTHTENTGYNLYIDEVRNYANLVSSLLGTDLSLLKEEERIVNCRELLIQHPYAYPLALELSLYMPSMTAVNWLHQLASTYYGSSLRDVYQEIDAFLVWRMDRKSAIFAAIAHATKGGYFLKSVDAYLSSYAPMLQAFLLKNRILCNTPQSFPSSLWFDHKINWLARIARKCILLLSRQTELPGRLLIKYLDYDLPPKVKPASYAAKAAAWCVMRLLTYQIKTGHSVYPARWAKLPSRIESGHIRQEEKKQPRFDVSTIIWGEEYIDRFARCNLPSLLASGNLPALSARGETRCVFYTTQESMMHIRRLPEYNIIKKYADIKFVFIDKILNDPLTKLSGKSFTDKYLPMMAAHNHFWNTCAAENRYAIYNFPDIVFHKDFFVKILDLYEQGKKYIFVYPGPYAVQEKMEMDLQTFFRNGVLEIDHRDLNRLIGKNRHPYAKLFYKNSPQHFFSATLTLKDVSNEGFIANTTCIAPILNKPNQDIVSINGTIDWFVTLTPLIKAEDIYIFKDTNEVCIASLEPQDGQDNAMKIGKYNINTFSKDICDTMRLFNRIKFSLPICFYRTNQPNCEIWEKFTQESRDESIHILQYRKNKLFPIPDIKYFLSDEVMPL